MKNKPEGSPQYFLSQIRKDVLESLTTEQKNEILCVLKRALKIRTDKLINVNITFWFIKKMFLTLYLGEEKRTAPRMANRKRDALVGIFLKILIYGSMLALIGTILFLSLYMIKSKMGIDIFPDKHLGDFF
jgi:hypothetical protein